MYQMFLSHWPNVFPNCPGAWVSYEMRSSSSRNLAHQYYHHDQNDNAQTVLRAQMQSQEKFIMMQVMQALLFTTR